MQLVRWFDYAEQVAAGAADPIVDRVEALEMLETVLGDAVRRQLVADVPVGAFLSGGIDSSLIAALAAKAMAGVASDVLNDPALLKAAKDEFAAFRAKNSFANPISDDVEPPLDMAAH